MSFNAVSATQHVSWSDFWGSSARLKDALKSYELSQFAGELEHAVKPQIKLKNVRVAVDLDELSRFPEASGPPRKKYRRLLVGKEGVGQRVHKPLLGVADTNHLLSIRIWVMHDNAEQLI